MKQNSPEWEAARLTTRNASEAAIVMGCAPKWWEVSTPAQLAAQKRTGLYSPPNAITGHGHDLEAVVRAALEERTGLLFAPQRFLVAPYAASLDGITLDGEVACEIKCPWRGETSKTWIHAVAGEVEDHYHWQHVHQSHCAPFRTLLFYVYLPDGRDQLIRRNATALSQSWEALETAWESWAQEYGL